MTALVDKKYLKLKYLIENILYTINTITYVDGNLFENYYY